MRCNLSFKSMVITIGNTITNEVGSAMDLTSKSAISDLVSGAKVIQLTPTAKVELELAA